MPQAKVVLLVLHNTNQQCSRHVATHVATCYYTHVKISQLVNKMCSQQSLSTSCNNVVILYKINILYKTNTRSILIMNI